MIVNTDNKPRYAFDDYSQTIHFFTKNPKQLDALLENLHFEHAFHLPKSKALQSLPTIHYLNPNQDTLFIGAKKSILTPPNNEQNKTIFKEKNSPQTPKQESSPIRNYIDQNKLLFAQIATEQEKPIIIDGNTIHFETGTQNTIIRRYLGMDRTQPMHKTTKTRQATYCVKHGMVRFGENKFTLEKYQMNDSQVEPYNLLLAIGKKLSKEYPVYDNKTMLQVKPQSLQNIYIQCSYLINGHLNQ